jgi:hypothetical protein
VQDWNYLLAFGKSKAQETHFFIKTICHKQPCVSTRLVRLVNETFDCSYGTSMFRRDHELAILK